MPSLLPTGHCFDDALDLITERVNESGAAVVDRLTLVHAICVATDGTRYAHAWVEEDGTAWDAAMLHGRRIYYAVAREEFEAARRVEQTTRYTIAEALAENARTQTYGPWRPEYQALCGRDGRIHGLIGAELSPELKRWQRNRLKRRRRAER